MFIVNRENAEHYQWGEACDGWRLVSRPELSVIEERIPPGLGEGAHFHERARQLFYMLAGRLRIELPDGEAVLGRWDSFEVEPGRVHRVHNPFEEDAVFLVVSSPTTVGDRTNIERECGRELARTVPQDDALLNIREATLADREPIYGFDELAQQEPDRTAFIDRAVRSGECLVAEVDGRIVAYGVLEYTFFGNGFVSMLYVAPVARRRGIGKALLRSLSSRCSTTKLFTSSNESNFAMRRLLEVLGWTPSGSISNLDVNDPELVYFFDRGGRTV